MVSYLKGEALEKVPVWRMISMPLNEIEKRAGLWAQELGDLARVIEGESMVGGGSLPGSTLPTRLVAIEGRGKQRNIALSLAQKLRRHNPPVIARISDDVLLLDPRTVLPEEDGMILQALRSAVASRK